MHRHWRWSPWITSVLAWLPLSFRFRTGCLFVGRRVMHQPSPGPGCVNGRPGVNPTVFISYQDAECCTTIEFETPPPPSFPNYSFVSLPLTCCQLGNAQHPATLPAATSQCAKVWVMPWINMLVYKGMSPGFAMRQFRCVWWREASALKRG